MPFSADCKVTARVLPSAARVCQACVKQELGLGAGERAAGGKAGRAEERGGPDCLRSPSPLYGGGAVGAAAR